MNTFEDGKIAALDGRLVCHIVKRVLMASKPLWDQENTSQFSWVYFLTSDVSNSKGNDVSRASDHKYHHSRAVNVFPALPQTGMISVNDMSVSLFFVAIDRFQFWDLNRRWRYVIPIDNALGTINMLTTICYHEVGQWREWRDWLSTTEWCLQWKGSLYCWWAGLRSLSAWQKETCRQKSLYVYVCDRECGPDLRA